MVPKSATDADTTVDDGVLAAVATGLWRMRSKMVEPETGQPLPGMRLLYRHLEATWDALAAAGVEIQSLDGAAADPGLALSVVAYQPTPGLDRARVVETIRPGVYRNSRVIQQSEVIVGTPADDLPDDTVTTEPDAATATAADTDSEDAPA